MLCCVVAVHCVVLYTPLISRVRGPYGKLWTEFFPSFYGPSAKRAGHENKEGKNSVHNLPYGPRTRLIRG